MRYIKNIKQYQKLFEGHFPYQHELTNEEVDKIYHYFYTYVFPQERIKLMEEILKESIIYSDFLEFYDKVNRPDRFQLRPSLGAAYSSLTGLTSIYSEMQRSILNNEPEFHHYQNKHIIKSGFEYIYYQRSFGENKHGYPYYEYRVALMVQTDMESEKENMSIAKLKKILGSDSYYSDRFIITDHLAQIIKRFAKHMDVETKVSVQNYGKEWRGTSGENCFSFEIRIYDLDFQAPPFE